MSYFAGLDPDVMGVVLVGAEGCAETQNTLWMRDATRHEQELFIEHCRELVRQAKDDKAAAVFDFTEFTIDGTGRPYWLKAVLDHSETPLIAREKAKRFTRVLRIHDT